MDRASGPVTGTVRRNWTAFKETVTDGTAGGEAAKYAFGGLIAFGVWSLTQMTIGLSRPDSEGM